MLTDSWWSYRLQTLGTVTKAEQAVPGFVVRVGAEELAEPVDDATDWWLCFGTVLLGSKRYSGKFERLAGRIAGAGAGEGEDEGEDEDGLSRADGGRRGFMLIVPNKCAGMAPTTCAYQGSIA